MCFWKVYCTRTLPTTKNIRVCFEYLMFCFTIANVCVQEVYECSFHTVLSTKSRNSVCNHLQTFANERGFKIQDLRFKKSFWIQDSKLLDSSFESRIQELIFESCILNLKSWIVNLESWSPLVCKRLQTLFLDFVLSTVWKEHS